MIFDTFWSPLMPPHCQVGCLFWATKHTSVYLPFLSGDIWKSTGAKWRLWLPPRLVSPHFPFQLMSPPSTSLLKPLNHPYFLSFHLPSWPSHYQSQIYLELVLFPPSSMPPCLSKPLPLLFWYTVITYQISLLCLFPVLFPHNSHRYFLQK